MRRADAFWCVRVFSFVDLRDRLRVQPVGSGRTVWSGRFGGGGSSMGIEALLATRIIWAPNRSRSIRHRRATDQKNFRTSQVA